MKLDIWTNEKAKIELAKRLRNCKDYRKNYEEQWRKNEKAVYEIQSAPLDLGPVDMETGVPIGGTQSADSLKLNYALKYIRFLHAQMSANPPSAIPRPTSQDVQDRNAASVANDLIQHGTREHKAQEIFDLVGLDSLIYGVGWLRSWFNPTKGDIRSFDKESGELEMTGDNEFVKHSVYDIWFDYSAKVWEDVRYVFVAHKMPLEQATYLWPNNAKELKNDAKDENERAGWFDEDKDKFKDEEVTVYEYIEKGLPWNGTIGRYAFILDDGTVLGELGENPFPGKIIPIHPLTDIDRPNSIMGEAITSYLVQCQDLLESIDSTMMDIFKAHLTVRMLLPEGAKVDDDSLSNDTFQAVKVGGGNLTEKPHFMAPPQIMPDIHGFRNTILIAMQDIAGVNESMEGKQSREMSGFSMQTAINAGNLTRRRLFNKYTALVKWAWDCYLNNVKEFWSDKRKVSVVGIENSMKVAYYSSSDLRGGFALQCDYGESFSLDPAARREEIIQLLPILEKAGMSPVEILNKIKLNDVGGLYDINSLASQRQEEIFEEMIASFDSGAPVYIAPKELQDHKGMLEAAYKFVMTKRFDKLDTEVQDMISQHIRERESMASKVQGQAMGAAMPPAGGMPPVGGLPPMPMPPM